jgi:hypothetical protein
MTLHELLHACWGQAKRSPDYDKQAWTELQAAVGELLRRADDEPRALRGGGSAVNV